jgi:hypothetical protein
MIFIFAIITHSFLTLNGALWFDDIHSLLQMFRNLHDPEK